VIVAGPPRAVDAVVENVKVPDALGAVAVIGTLTELPGNSSGEVSVTVRVSELYEALQVDGDGAATVTAVNPAGPCTVAWLKPNRLARLGGIDSVTT
jgi:hypothetical protein